jgi:hypothetical protein
LVFTLAKEGGFTERELMEELPVYRVNCYYHAALRSHDVWCVREQPPVDVQIDDLLAFAISDQTDDFEL